MNTVHLCDCQDFMRDKPDNCYDLAICDPPYGIGKDGQRQSICKNPKHNRKEFVQKEWDGQRPGKEYFTEVFRISMNQIIWGANYYPEYLISSMGWVFWDKGQNLFQSDGELAYTSFNVALRRVIINRVELLKEGTIHPTQKPIKLYKYLLQNYAKPGQTIFDSHVGSGSIRIACHDMGFDFEGCEIDKDYWQAQEERYQRHCLQGELFDKGELQDIIYET